MQVFYLGRAPRTKETLPDFLKWRRVTRHPLVFCGLTGSQRTPGFGASQRPYREGSYVKRRISHHSRNKKPHSPNIMRINRLLSKKDGSSFLLP